MGRFRHSAAPGRRVLGVGFAGLVPFVPGQHPNFPIVAALRNNVVIARPVFSHVSPLPSSRLVRSLDLNLRLCNCRSVRCACLCRHWAKARQGPVLQARLPVGVLVFPCPGIQETLPTRPWSSASRSSGSSGGMGPPTFASGPNCHLTTCSPGNFARFH